MNEEELDKATFEAEESLKKETKKIAQIIVLKKRAKINKTKIIIPSDVNEENKTLF